MDVSTESSAFDLFLECQTFSSSTNWTDSAGDFLQKRVIFFLFIKIRRILNFPERELKFAVDTETMMGKKSSRMPKKTIDPWGQDS